MYQLIMYFISYETRAKVSRGEYILENTSSTPPGVEKGKKFWRKKFKELSTKQLKSKFQKNDWDTQRLFRLLFGWPTKILCLAEEILKTFKKKDEKHLKRI